MFSVASYSTTMESKTPVTVETKPPMLDIKNSIDYEHGVINTIIYIDPEKEAAALRKFDRYVVPVSVIYLVLSTLDRNNVSEACVSGESHHC